MVEAARLDRRAAVRAPAAAPTSDGAIPGRARPCAANRPRGARFGDLALAQSMKASWTSCSGTAVPMALMNAVVRARNSRAGDEEAWSRLDERSAERSSLPQRAREGDTLFASGSGCCGGENGAQGRNRTTDTVIFSHVLYQLSYLGISGGARKRGAYRGASARRCPARPGTPARPDRRAGRARDSPRRAS